MQIYNNITINKSYTVFIDFPSIPLYSPDTHLNPSPSNSHADYIAPAEAEAHHMVLEDVAQDLHSQEDPVTARSILGKRNPRWARYYMLGWWSLLLLACDPFLVQHQRRILLECRVPVVLVRIVGNYYMRFVGSSSRGTA